MAAPPVAANSLDLIWSEGAIYFLGIETALRDWRPLLANGGTIAFTEPLWLQSSRPKELSDWWHTEYPAITDEDGVLDIIRQAGFETIGFFPLPADAWKTEYYEPMRFRITQLRDRYPNDPTASEIAASAESEIDVHNRYSEFYTYGFFVAQPNRAGSTRHKRPLDNEDRNRL